MTHFLAQHSDSIVTAVAWLAISWGICVVVGAAWRSTLEWLDRWSRE